MIRVDHRTVQRHGPHVTGLAAVGGECPEHKPAQPDACRVRTGCVRGKRPYGTGDGSMNDTRRTTTCPSCGASSLRCYIGSSHSLCCEDCPHNADHIAAVRDLVEGDAASATNQPRRADEMGDHIIPADLDRPALFYLGTDGTLYRLDFDPPLPGSGGTWTLDATEREQALCLSLLRFALRRTAADQPARGASDV